MPRSNRDRSNSAAGLGAAGEIVSEGTAKRSYLRPALRKYGRLVDVTRFGGSQIVDSGMGTLRNP